MNGWKTEDTVTVNDGNQPAEKIFSFNNEHFVMSKSAWVNILKEDYQ